ncbi:MAG: CapA family protein [Nitrospirota bacterium]
MRCLFEAVLPRVVSAAVARLTMLLAVGGVVLAHGTGVAGDPPQVPPPSDLPVASSNPEPQADVLTVVAVGDIMPGSLTPIPFIPAPADHEIPASIRRVIGDGDIVFGNLEGTLVTDGIAPTKCRPEAREALRCFEFGSPPFLASFLKEAGFTVLSLDNNHAEDYGLEGYVLTQGLLAQTGITGVPKRTPVVFGIRDVRVAVVPFGFSGRSFHVSDLPTARTVVAEAARTADIVLVSFHGGAEGGTATRVPHEVETYLEEDRGDLIEFAHAVIDTGADLVIGHGPHVPRAVELYRNRLIAYSLGNFWTYGNISIKGVKGIMPLLRVTLGRDGAFYAGRIVSMRQRLPGIPELDPQGEAVRLMATLSQEDIPANPIVVDEESGAIHVRPPALGDAVAPNTSTGRRIEDVPRN